MHRKLYDNNRKLYEVLDVKWKCIGEIIHIKANCQKNKYAGQASTIHEKAGFSCVSDFPVFVHVNSLYFPCKRFFGDTSVSLRRIWMKLGENSSYKPPGASYTAQGPQKQPEIFKNTAIRIQLNTIHLVFRYSRSYSLLGELLVADEGHLTGVPVPTLPFFLFPWQERN